MKNTLIILDNGHGINTPGKRSVDGRLKEYAYTRLIVKMIYNQLISLGYNVHILVPEEIDISLSTRVNRANKLYINNDYNAILISIHNNAAGNGDKWYNATGWEAYTSKGSTKSDKLATCLYDAAKETLKIRCDWSDGDIDKESNFYILTKTKCPAVLTENLFMDSKQDVDFLLTDYGKKTIVDIHVNGIINYLKNV